MCLLYNITEKIITVVKRYNVYHYPLLNVISQGEMTVGDVVSYCMPLTPGDWATSAPLVLWVDTHSGLATALRPGQTIIKYTLTSTSSSVTTATQVTVLPIHSVSCFILHCGSVLINTQSHERQSIYRLTYTYLIL